MSVDQLQKEFRGMKMSLTRALNSKDPKKIITICDKTLARFEEIGYPDNWHNWQRAKDDAEFQLRMKANW